MYRAMFAETLEDDPAVGRARERRAFDHAIGLLLAAEDLGPRSTQALEAVRFLEQFWVILLEDLASEGNELPASLRAGLISIGIWITREIGEVRQGKADSLLGLVEINTIIRDGLN